MSRSVPTIEILVGNATALINKYLYLGVLDANNITTDICFDCNLWENGFMDNSVKPPVVIIPPIKTMVHDLLNDMIAFLENTLINPSIRDYGFKTQLERLMHIIIDLSNKINSIQCVAVCSDYSIISQLLTTLVLTLLKLISLFELLNGLLAYLSTCGCTGYKVFEMLIGRFINTITELQELIQDWYVIVMIFFQYSSMPSKPYVASYIPKQQIPQPQMPQPQMHACVPCPPRPPQPYQPCAPNNYTIYPSPY